MIISDSLKVYEVNEKKAYFDIGNNLFLSDDMKRVNLVIETGPDRVCDFEVTDADEWNDDRNWLSETGLGYAGITECYTRRETIEIEFFRDLIKEIDKKSI